MARKWEISDGKYAWNMEACEELLLIAGYMEIKPFIPPGSSWADEFENHFFQHGNGTSFAAIDHINAARRRRDLPVLQFLETDVLDYGRCTDKLMKSETRRRVRDELSNLSVDLRMKRIARAGAEAATLVPPHIPYEQWRNKKQSYETENLLSREEVARRFQATRQVQVQAPAPAPAKPANLPIDKAVTMLRFASDPELRSGIIAKLTADDALAVLEKVESAEIRDALIRHSLNA